MRSRRTRKRRAFNTAEQFAVNAPVVRYMYIAERDTEQDHGKNFGEGKSQSTRAVCFVLFELSILYLLQSASRLTDDPGYLSLANCNVSIIVLFIFFLPIIESSLLM